MFDLTDIRMLFANFGSNSGNLLKVSDEAGAANHSEQMPLYVYEHDVMGPPLSQLLTATRLLS